MSPHPDMQRPQEVAYRRRVLFAVELLDAATLQRVTQGVKVEAVGLRGKPVVNAGGLFVWLEEDFQQLQRISVNPVLLPYEPVERAAAQVHKPLTKIELQPRIDYPFATGVTGLRGMLVESNAVPPEPVEGAGVSLQWLDENGVWQNSHTASHTDQRGDFVSILRLAANEKPTVEAGGAVTVRLRVSRAGFSNHRRSPDFKLLLGRVTNPTTSMPLTFAWNDLIA